MQGDLSYSAWSGGVTNYSAVPVRLDVAPEERSSAEEGCVSASAWNQAGTFETRDLSNWAQEDVKGRLKGLEAAASDGTLVRVTGVTSVSGEAAVHFVRGKRRHGFDLEIKLAVETSGDPVAKGSLTIPSVGPEDIDCPEDLHADVDGAVREFKERALLLRARICEELAQFYAALKEK